MEINRVDFWVNYNYPKGDTWGSDNVFPLGMSRGKSEIKESKALYSGDIVLINNTPYIIIDVIIIDFSKEESYSIANQYLLEGTSLDAKDLYDKNDVALMFCVQEISYDELTEDDIEAEFYVN